VVSWPVHRTLGFSERRSCCRPEFIAYYNERCTFFLSRLGLAGHWRLARRQRVAKIRIGCCLASRIRLHGCKIMSRWNRILFLALIIAQAAHSFEEYSTRVYDVLAPARVVRAFSLLTVAGLRHLQRRTGKLWPLVFFRSRCPRWPLGAKARLVLGGARGTQRLRPHRLVGFDGCLSARSGDRSSPTRNRSGVRFAAAALSVHNRCSNYRFLSPPSSIRHAASRRLKRCRPMRVSSCTNVPAATPTCGPG
jgi:hypothetical protein